MTDYTVTWQHPRTKLRYKVLFNENNHAIAVHVIVAHGAGNYVREYERLLWTTASARCSENVTKVILAARQEHIARGGT